MMLPFTKMHSLGNDFIVLDCTEQPLPLSPEDMRRIADRHVGVGFDQLLVVEPSTTDSVDFHYRIFNADGSEVAQCGNGARCLGRFLYEKQLTNKNKIFIATESTMMTVSIDSENRVSVTLPPPSFVPEDIPLNVPAQQQHYLWEGLEFGACSVGNPHAVVSVDAIDKADLESVAKQLVGSALFPAGVNVSVMQRVTDDHIRLRVFERGAGETSACGSGACAAVAIGRLWEQLVSTVTVNLPGGDLVVEWSSPTAPLILTGPAEFVFEGEVYL